MARAKAEKQEKFMDAGTRAAWVAKLQGCSGPQLGREESVTYSITEDGFEEVLLYTTRGATVAELLESDRPVKSVEAFNDDVFKVRLSGSEYRAGGILKALKATRNMSEEAREAAGQRLAAGRARRNAATSESADS
jgi:hypothetical protein